jgi:hypothetical protein
MKHFYSPFSGPGGFGYTPAQIKHAYGIDQVLFNGAQGDGSGTTIAIVDAYNQPNMASDLHQFDLAFGLPDPQLTIVNQTGGSNLPPSDSGWGGEISLDVEWAHAIAPGAKILLVEANSASGSDLFAAVKYAATVSGVVVVSNSWGGGESSGETSLDSTFLTPAGHTPITFLVASGDNGAPANYPATSPNVVAVGGTSLNLDAAGNILGESGWSGSSGGPSQFESQPSYQKGVVTQTTTQRANPDVAWLADPNTGVPVYDSYGSGGNNWSTVGGTSLSCPSWAALLAIADQGRALAGESALDGVSQTLPMLYSLPQSDFHDIVTGSSQGSPAYQAGPGYDYVTGRGTPIANLIVPALIGTGPTSPIVFNSLTVNPNPVSEGQTATLSATFSDSQRPSDPYSVVINWGDGSTNTTLTLSPGQHSFSADHIFAVGNGSSFTVKVTVTDSLKESGSGSVNVTVNDIPPTVTITNVPVGSQPDTKAITLNSLVSSSSKFHTYSYAWAVTKNGNSYLTGTNPSLTFTPDDQGSYVVNLTVTDDAGGVGVASPVAIQVYDAPPSANGLTNNGPVKVGNSATLTVVKPTAASSQVTAGLLFDFSNNVNFSGGWTVTNLSTASTQTLALSPVGLYTFYARIHDVDGTFSQVYSTTVMVNTTGTGNGGIITTRYVVAGSDASPGITSEIQAFTTAGKLTYTLTPFGVNYTSGYRVAVGDVNGDGIEDFIVAPGAGGGPSVRVISGADGSTTLAQFTPYGAGYNSGFYVVSGDLNRDGYSDIVIAPDKGTVSEPVVAYSGFNNAQLFSYSPFGTSYKAGISIGLGDVNGDGFLDLVTGQLTTGSKVQVNLGKTDSSGGLNTSVYRTISSAMPSGYNGGVYVAAGDLNGDGKADVIVGSNTSFGHESVVRAYSGSNNALLYNFVPFTTYTLGIRVAVDDLDGDGKADLLISPAKASTGTLFSNPRVIGLKGSTLAGIFLQTLNDSPFQGGVFVG